jgi:molybdopterin-guanine dinucleotide biosynthesis protein A
MTNEIIQSLWITGNHKTDALVPMVKNYLQPTCGFYHKRILKLILQQIKTNDLSLHGLLNSINTNTVNLDLNEKEFTNMNTASDYDGLLRKEKTQ